MPVVWRQDNGVGGFEDAVGVPHALYANINYTTGALSFDPRVTGLYPVASYKQTKIGKASTIDLSVGGVDVTGMEPDATANVYRNVLKGITYEAAPSMFPLEGGWVKVRYATSDSANSHTDTVVWDKLALDVTPDYAEQVVGGSLRLSFGGKVLLDRLGTIVTDLNHSNGAATAIGQIDYAAGTMTLNTWTPGAANTGTVTAMLTNVCGQAVDVVTFRVPAVPVRPSSFIMQFTLLGEEGINTVSADASGEITGTNIYGTINYQTGVVKVYFGAWVTAAGKEAEWWYPEEPEAVINGKVFQPKMVYADLIRYACVSYSYLPLDEDILGLNPVRLPSDGRVVIFKPGDVLVVHNTQHIVGTYNNQSVNLGRTRVARVRVFDADGVAVDPAKWTADLDAGTVQIGDMSGVAQPIDIEHRIEDMGLCSDAQISGLLTMTRPVTHTYPVPGSHVSSALIIGDMQGRYTNLFEQSSWSGAWSDTPTSSPTASYNDRDFPIGVSNAGVVQERWALIFTSQTQVRVVGETVGQVAEAQPIVAPIAPNNPATGEPYFTVQPEGWGTGWASGNVLRFNIIASNFPVWIARTIQQGPATEESDSFCIQIRGDIDRV
jgi:hypothetical protein